MNNKAEFVFDPTIRCFICKGSWSVAHLEKLNFTFVDVSLIDGEHITINGNGITYFDSAGALTLLKYLTAIHQLVPTATVTFKGFKRNQEKIMQLIKNHTNNLEYVPTSMKSENILHRIGVETVKKLGQIDGFIILVGGLSLKIFEAVADWRRFHWHSIVSNINSGCIQALPIVALLSFLIGVVLAYQMGLQLKTYGANIFIAYLSGMAIFREFSPLITAIIVAGRTSSAFTAQIGSMKINVEIDALHTMGLSPTELLVAPKMLGLMMVFPLLIFWSHF